MKLAIILSGSFLIFVLVVILGIYFWPSPPKQKVIDYSKYTVGISYASPNGDRINIGYAVVAGEGKGFLNLLTAKHIVEDNNRQYIAIFSNGIQKPIEKVTNPISNEDIALLSITFDDISNGEEYMIPRFLSAPQIPQGSAISIFKDDYYGIEQRNIISSTTDGNLSTIYLPGKIAKGRSGSPVFIKGSDQCIGIVSGYFTKESSMGENTRVLLYVTPSGQ